MHTKSEVSPEPATGGIFDLQRSNVGRVESVASGGAAPAVLDSAGQPPGGNAYARTGEQT